MATGWFDMWSTVSHILMKPYGLQTFRAKVESHFGWPTTRIKGMLFSHQNSI